VGGWKGGLPGLHLPLRAGPSAPEALSPGRAGPEGLGERAGAAPGADEQSPVLPADPGPHPHAEPPSGGVGQLLPVWTSAGGLSRDQLCRAEASSGSFGPTESASLPSSYGEELLQALCRSWPRVPVSSAASTRVGLR